MFCLQRRLKLFQPLKAALNYSSLLCWVEGKPRDEQIILTFQNVKQGSCGRAIKTDFWLGLSYKESSDSPQGFIPQPWLKEQHQFKEACGCCSNVLVGDPAGEVWIFTQSWITPSAQHCRAWVRCKLMLLTSYPCFFAFFWFVWAGSFWVLLGGITLAFGLSQAWKLQLQLSQILLVFHALKVIVQGEGFINVLGLYT